MATAGVPDAAAPCGKKIDHVARAIGHALAAHGFQRKGRRLVAGRGTGDGRHRCVVQLESGKWNSGPCGSFHVALGVVYPALVQLRARDEGRAWMLEHLGDPDLACAQAKGQLCRLQAALPEGDALALPPDSDEYRIDAPTDLAAFEGPLLACGVDHRIAAAVLLGDMARAQQVLTERRERYEYPSAHFRRWLTDLGLDASVLASGPRPPSDWEQRQEARRQAEEAQARHEAEAIRQSAGAGTPEARAAAWVAE